MIPFTLTPFDSREAPDIELTGTVDYHDQILAIAYELQGNLAPIELADPHNWPTRRYELWEKTCFECFFAQPEDSTYWEVNLSPSGDWNVFRFTGYREGIIEEPQITDLRSTEERDFNWVQVKFTLDISPLVPPAAPLELGVTAVIESRDRPLSYWALTHPKPEADFHDRASFAIVLP